MRTHLLALGAALLLAASACSTQDEAESTSPKTPTATHLAGSELRSSLLTLDDMVEPGFIQTDADEDRARTYFCDYEPPATPTDTYMTEFEKTDKTSFSLVRSVADEFESADDAKAQIAAAAKTLETCDSATVAGAKQTYSVVSAPDLGDRALAVKIETTVNDVPVVMHQVFVQSANAILQTSTAVGGTETGDADAVAALATAQAEKLATAGDQG
ncbi:hypothetical protein [Aeromicrobium massiliense]|uniref:hypothetical protein n=1 Tax=Aeromicrobium massiliense TaxID=1464554 RepID=UPI0002D4EF04|nr:hypothetical protein [Aeromicrobium massiliense]